MVLNEIAKRSSKLLDLSRGEPGFCTPDPILTATKEALDASDLPDVRSRQLPGKYTHYEAVQGASELRRAISNKYQEESGLSFDPDRQILITHGGTEAIFLTLFSIVSPGDEVVITDPCYSQYQRVISSLHCVPVKVRVYEENEFQPEPQEILRRITNKTRLIILNSPNNPTGAVYDRENLREVMGIAASKDIYVMHDEVHEKVLSDNIHHYPIALFDGDKRLSILVNSFSKTYAMTGWRLGWLVANPEIIRIAAESHRNINSSINTFVQHAGVAALTDHRIQERVQEMVKEYEIRKTFFIEALSEVDGFECPPSLPKGTFYVFPNVQKFYDIHKEQIQSVIRSELLDGRLNEMRDKRGIEDGFDNILRSVSLSVALFLACEANVLCLPGMNCGEGGDNHLRFSFSVNEECLREACRRIREATNKKSGG